jgi:hypothetical protein
MSKISKNQFKLLFLELKIEIRKVSNAVRDFAKKSHFFPFLFKSYLLVIVCFSVFSLLGIATNASSKDRLSVNSEAELVLDSSPLVFLAPANFIPQVKAEETNSYYSSYKIKEGETAQILADRFTVTEDSLTLNNPGKEFKKDIQIVKPQSNGYLLGYNKDTNTEEVAKASGLSVDEVNKQRAGKDEGYILLTGETANKAKENYEVNITKIRYQISQATKIRIAQEQASQIEANNASYSPVNIPTGGNFSSQLSSFISQTRGVRQNDGSGGYYGECVSLVKQWQLFIGAQKGVWPGGHPIAAYYSFLSGYKSMAVSTNAYNVYVVQDPGSLKSGDIVVLTGYPSHTGIATGLNSSGTYQLYEQNSPYMGAPPSVQTHSNSSFIGALRYVPR